MNQATIGKILNQTCDSWGIKQSELFRKTTHPSKRVIAVRAFLCHMWTLAGHSSPEIARYLWPLFSYLDSPAQQEAARAQGQLAKDSLLYRLRESATGYETQRKDLK